MIFHPRQNSKAQLKLEQESTDYESWRSLERNPLLHHLVLVTSYLDSWRAVLRHLGKQYQEQVRYNPSRRRNLLTTSREMSWQPSISRTRLILTAQSILKRYSNSALGDRIQTVFEMLKTNQILLESLLKMNEDLFSECLYDEKGKVLAENALRSVLLRVNGHRNSADSLGRRVAGINKLVCDMALPVQRRGLTCSGDRRIEPTPPAICSRKSGKICNDQQKRVQTHERECGRQCCCLCGHAGDFDILTWKFCCGTCPIRKHMSFLLTDPVLVR